MTRPIWVQEPTPYELNLRCQNSLSDHLGIEFTSFTSISLSARMRIDQRTIQPMEIMHGGASAALAETVGSAAGNYCIHSDLYYCVGIELNINHLKAAKEGWVHATATPLHLGKQTQVWEIKIQDDNGTLISAARLTLMVLEKKKGR